MILETALKWAIPALCVAIIGVITAKIIKPIQKQNAAQEQADWDEHMRQSTVPQTFCDQTYDRLRQESDQKDQEIINKIDKLCNTIDSHNNETIAYRKTNDKQIELIQEGVRDVHLQNLIHTCETYIKRGYITSAEREIYQQRYKLYKSLGGNGHMEPWDAKIQALPSEPPQSDSYVVHPTQLPTPPTTHI